MQKTDFKKVLKDLYAPSAGDFSQVVVPEMRFVKVDGAGNPNTVEAYRSGVEWLYGTSYAMKFACKAELERDYVVLPLEGLWWAEDPAAFAARKKDLWQWTMMIMVPEFVTRAIFEAAVLKTAAKRKQDAPPSFRLESLDEGLCLQALHVGSYDDEGPALARLHDETMPAQGLTFNGPHHEIYLSDPRRVAAEKLKTVLRQPVRLMTQ
jgi:hypothetical protein